MSVRERAASHLAREMPWLAGGDEAAPVYREIVSFMWDAGWRPVGPDRDERRPPPAGDTANVLAEARARIRANAERSREEHPE